MLDSKWNINHSNMASTTIKRTYSEPTAWDCTRTYTIFRDSQSLYSIKNLYDVKITHRGLTISDDITCRMFDDFYSMLCDVAREEAMMIVPHTRLTIDYIKPHVHKTLFKGDYPITIIPVRSTNNHRAINTITMKPIVDRVDYDRFVVRFQVTYS